MCCCKNGEKKAINGRATDHHDTVVKNLGISFKEITKKVKVSVSTVSFTIREAAKGTNHFTVFPKFVSVNKISLWGYPRGCKTVAACAKQTLLCMQWFICVPAVELYMRGLLILHARNLIGPVK